MSNTDPFISHVESNVEFCSEIIIDLGCMNILVRTNKRNFRGYNHFAKLVSFKNCNANTDFEIYCIDLESEQHINYNYVKQFADKTYRSRMFTSGYYVTDKFGPEICLVTKGHRYYIFGTRLERVLWPYLVKYLLTIHSITDNSLHLKAASFEVNSFGTLLFGRGGAGKTVFLSQICLRGAWFVSNTHVYVKDGIVCGVPSNMRVRNDACFRDLIHSNNLPESIKTGEFLLNPYSLFNSRTKETTNLKNLCLIDFNKESLSLIKTIDKKYMYNYLEQFSLPINVYGLKEDLLDYFENDYASFSRVYTLMKNRLQEIVEKNNCFYISADMTKQENQKKIYELLSQ